MTLVHSTMCDPLPVRNEGDRAEPPHDHKGANDPSTLRTKAGAFVQHAQADGAANCSSRKNSPVVRGPSFGCLHVGKQKA